jgi:hypothetical protein
MTAFTPAETLHRLVKQAIDSGAAASIAEAQTLFAGYQLALRMEAAVARDAHHQATLLTAVALARRVFLGGVTVSAPPDVPLAPPLLSFGQNLAEAVAALGGHLGPIPDGVPLVEIGGARDARSSDAFHVRTLFAGWRGGIVPTHIDAAPAPAPVMALSPMLAAALAVNEAFLFVSGSSTIAGRRTVGLSLWAPAAESNWLTANEEPALHLLPSGLWLIGLGHLGQAYLWGVGLLPYPDPAQLRLVLQDIDVITPSTESTSVLSDAKLVGQKKTRAMATWAEQRGFHTAITERLFDKDFRRHPDEPAVALCGLDNALGRQALDQVGFDFVVEAGLGRGYRDFRAIRLHTLPASRNASEIWKIAPGTDDTEDRPAYQAMLTHGELDRCGVTLLAGKAVGAPFVGAVAATLALSEILRLLHGGPVHELIDLDLKAPDYRCAVPTQSDFSRLNPGYVLMDA